MRQPSIISFITDRNKYFLSLFILCILNLLYMHYFFRLSFRDGSEYLVYAYHWITNFMLTIFDVTLLLSMFLLLTRGRTKFCLCLTFVFTWLWSVINIVYGRFFHHYLPLSSICEAPALTDSMVLSSALSGFRWTDTFYIFTLTLFIFIYRKSRLKKSGKIMALWCITTLIITSCSPYVIYTVYHIANPSSRYNWKLYKIRMKNDIYRIMPIKDCFPNVVRFQWGCATIAIADICDAMRSRDLTQKQINEIVEMGIGNNKVSKNTRPASIQNVTFIILESFLSASIDLKINGKAITPNLNNLKADTSVYYNGCVKPNITIGESGDGQFIYMTGILPLRFNITVGIVNNQRLPGLPGLLKSQAGIQRTEIIIPGLPTVWRQNEMNIAYGIDHMLSASSLFNNVEITDKEVFDAAIRSGKSQNEPFFSMILSCSTHMPYDKNIDASFIINDSTLPESYRHYLNACHFADIQIGKYLSELKKKGIYENNLIIIAADHDAHLDLLGMEGKIANYLPLFIINGDINNAKAWHGEMNQIDIYTTILDLLGIETDWHGLGNTIFSTNYVNPVSDKAWNVSEWIIRGDYFSKGQ